MTIHVGSICTILLINKSPVYINRSRFC